MLQTRGNSHGSPHNSLDRTRHMAKLRRRSYVLSSLRGFLLADLHTHKAVCWWQCRPCYFASLSSSLHWSGKKARWVISLERFPLTLVRRQVWGSQGWRWGQPESCCCCPGRDDKGHELTGSGLWTTVKIKLQLIKQTQLWLTVKIVFLNNGEEITPWVMLRAKLKHQPRRKAVWDTSTAKK